MIRLKDDNCVFRVWAPEKEALKLFLVEGNRTIDMEKREDGYFSVSVSGVKEGARYFYEGRYPDPESAYQPDGVHGASAVVDHTLYHWEDADWRGLAFSSLIFYELHVGAFTPEGTFEAVLPRLDELAATGINAIELMPVAACPGHRNWGYDGVGLYAVQADYGGPEGLKRLVDGCHQRGIAVFLDVVYNHLGPEGNYLSFFGPYFTDKYQTPWGKALNLDGPESDGVKEYIIRNVLYWAEQYHIDGLRLDAIHEMYDRNAVTIWDQLHSRVRDWEQGSGRRFYLIAESDHNSPRVVRPPEAGGYGLNAQWLDDFHHALYVLLDEEGRKHYRDFGALEQLAKAYTDGFVHSGEYVRFRHRRHGASSAGIPGDRFIVFNQNHDLPGNRPGGERLSVLVDLPRLKLAAAAVLLSPYIPLLFMGEEYGEEAPFFFFSDYGDPQIIAGLREGRKKEFAAFEWGEEPPDSQEEETFRRSKLQWERRREGGHLVLLEWHRQLIGLRRSHSLLRDLSKNMIRADLVAGTGLALHRHSADGRCGLLCLFNFSGEELEYSITYGDGEWKKLLDSADVLPGGVAKSGGAPEAVATGGPVRLSGWGAVVYETKNTY